jgi:hypothetical protein
MNGLVGGHELESLDGIDVVSFANQAAAFLKICRGSPKTLGIYPCRAFAARRRNVRLSLVGPRILQPVKRTTELQEGCLALFLRRRERCPELDLDMPQGGAAARRDAPVRRRRRQFDERREVKVAHQLGRRRLGAEAGVPEDLAARIEDPLGPRADFLRRSSR